MEAFNTKRNRDNIKNENRLQLEQNLTLNQSELVQENAESGRLAEGEAGQ
mgnify:CR=1 FL=1